MSPAAQRRAIDAVVREWLRETVARPPRPRSRASAVDDAHPDLDERVGRALLVGPPAGRELVA